MNIRQEYLISYNCVQKKTYSKNIYMNPIPWRKGIK